MRIDTYVKILEKLVRESEDDKECEEKVGWFLRFVAHHNDVQMLKKIYGRFSFELSKKEGVDKISMEYAPSTVQKEAWVKKIKEIFKENGKGTLIEHGANPNLLSGVKIIRNDSYLIEASFNKLVNQLFKS